MIVFIAAGCCLLISVALWKSSFKFTVDAAPIGSLMLVASILCLVASLFLFGVAMGRL